MNAQAAFVRAWPYSHGARLTDFARCGRAPRLRGLAFIALLLWSVSGFSQVPAQGTSPAPTVIASAPASGKVSATHPAKVPFSRPTWTELTPAQQQALAPLASSWNTIMSEPQKRKWLEISKNYSTLTPEGQVTLNSRMNEWVALSPQQRAQARLNFGKTKELARQLTPEEKKARWEAYQALSVEEKQKLAAKASPNPAGAATAVKPVSPQKLATVPHAVKPGAKPEPKITALPAATLAPPGASTGGEAAAAPPQR